MICLDPDGLRVTNYQKIRYEPAEWKPKPGRGPYEHPDILARWWERMIDRNGRPLSDVPPTLGTVAWYWECDNGHQWRESVGHLTAKSSKKHRIKAMSETIWCRECAVAQYGMIYEQCGHRSESATLMADPPAVRTGLCGPCKGYNPRPLYVLGAVDPNPPRPTRRERSRNTIREAAQQGHRTWTLPDPESDPAWGTRSPRREHSWTSLDEQRVLAFLTDAGFEATTGRVTVPDLIHLPEGIDATWQCTPDVLIDRVAIEVDSPNTRGGGPSHVMDEFPAEDLYRDDCLRAAGYTVVRVRLGGLPPVPDAHNVLRDGNLTLDVLALIAEAVRDAQNGEPATDRKAGAIKGRAKPASPLSAITQDRYHPGAYTFTFEGDHGKRRFRTMCGGRYVHADRTGISGPRTVFVARVDLDTLDKKLWRDRLLETPQLAAPPAEGPEYPFEGPFATFTPPGSDTVTPGISTQIRDVYEQTLIWVELPEPVVTAIFHDNGDVGLEGETGTDLGTLTLSEGARREGFEVIRVSSRRAGAVVECTCNQARIERASDE